MESEDRKEKERGKKRLKSTYKKLGDKIKSIPKSESVKQSNEQKKNEHR